MSKSRRRPKRMTRLYIVAIRVGLLVAALVGCVSCVTYKPITSDMKKLFVGNYIATLSGDREVSLTIHDDLTFEYVEDSYRRGHVAQVFRRGDLRAVGRRSARAGLIQLKWISPGNIRASSPYGGGRRPNSSGGGSVGRSGMIWAEGSHVFFLRRR